MVLEVTRATSVRVKSLCTGHAIITPQLAWKEPTCSQRTEQGTKQPISSHILRLHERETKQKARYLVNTPSSKHGGNVWVFKFLFHRRGLHHFSDSAIQRPTETSLQPGNSKQTQYERPIMRWKVTVESQQSQEITWRNYFEIIKFFFIKPDWRAAETTVWAEDIMRAGAKSTRCLLESLWWLGWILLPTV